MFHFLFLRISSQMDISCRNTKQSVGNIITQSNFLTLKYICDGWGTDSNGFKLILTAIKNISKLKTFLHSIACEVNLWTKISCISDHSCKEFRCKSTEFCISSDLMCDGINHCGDGTDEAPYSPCPSKFFFLFQTFQIQKNISKSSKTVHSRCGAKNDFRPGNDMVGTVGSEWIFGAVRIHLYRHYVLSPTHFQLG